MLARPRDFSSADRNAVLLATYMSQRWLIAAAVVAPVSAAQLKATVEELVSFGTRHTLSSQTDPKRGIGAALGWAEAELNRDSAACGGCLVVGRTSDVFTGERLPGPTKIIDVFAVQRGTERPNDVVIITGHIDSRVT